eukprot:TRINITY_DN3723_c1_g1_i2.p3 TRINITY_DN3723_c1_g1~~TRINITY_DN3723_c1_g1_i2.p3  ORF type:complete len:100 (-),score=1.55 TRINITY_DN3723_c1_g1_i2:38-337(-)
MVTFCVLQRKCIHIECYLRSNFIAFSKFFKIRAKMAHHKSIRQLGGITTKLQYLYQIQKQLFVLFIVISKFLQAATFVEVVFFFVARKYSIPPFLIFHP